MRVLNIKGAKFNRLLVVEMVSKSVKGSVWKCKCDCGVVKNLLGDRVKNGYIKSCGCLVRETVPKIKIALKHGMSKTPIYNVWCTMKARCSNPNHIGFHNYGGRSIKVCDRWLKFDNFNNDMKNGYRKGLTLDRVDNKKGYSKNNCRWATHIEQQNNRSNNHLITYNGKTQTLSQWARSIGLKPGVLYLRVVRRGWDISRAITTPLLRV